LRLEACSLSLAACSLVPVAGAIAGGPGKPGPLVLLDVDSLLLLPVFQPLRDIIIRNEEAQPQEPLLFRYMHPDIIGYFLLSFKSYYKIILFYFHIFSFLNSSYTILHLLSSLKLAACNDQPTPESLCSSGGGALTDPRSINCWNYRGYQLANRPGISTL